MKRKLHGWLAALFFCALGSAQAAANTEANTLIVQDASGSKKNINADCESGSNAPCARELPPATIYL